jgi:DNA-binding PadR family transcriptional regulator
MSSDRLTPLSYAVLVLVGRAGAGPHDLVRMARQGRVYWSAAESQFYAEPKRLERLGLLSSSKLPGRTRERTHYRLTSAGEAALREWAETPVGFPRLQHEAVLRVLAVDLVGREAVLLSLQSLRDELDAMDARLDTADEIASSIPHRETALRLNHRLARALVEAHRTWLADLDRELR